MNEVSGVSEEDKELMKQYNIIMETKNVFHYEDYKYDRLQDAIRYAKSALAQKQASSDH